MCDDSLEEDLERYRRNNTELAMALNDMKMELNILQEQLLDKNRELQNVYRDNALLKSNVAHKDNQINTWRSMILELVTTNTRKYTEVMQKIGLVPASSGAAKPFETSKITIETKVTATDAPDRTNFQRKYRQNDDYAGRLSNLTEESINSLFNESKDAKTPEKRKTNVTTRRRASSFTPMSPNSPLRLIQERMIGNGETIPVKSSVKVVKMESIVDENTESQPTNARPSRKKAPKNLCEPKLSTKMRRT